MDFTFFGSDLEREAIKMCHDTRNEAEFVAMVQEKLEAPPQYLQHYLEKFLYFAVFSGFMSAVSLLLDNGAPITDFTVSIIAEAPKLPTHKVIAMYQSFLYAGWGINRRMRYYGDAVHQAVQNNNHTLLQWLLDNGADPRVNDNFMLSLLQYAVLKASPVIVIMLIEQGNLDPNNCRALEIAGREGDIKLVRALLDLGADVNRVVDHPERGYATAKERAVGFGTALHRAAEKGHLDIVRLLLERGADPHLQDTKGLTPYDWARRRLRVRVMLLLRNTMKNGHFP